MSPHARHWLTLELDCPVCHAMPGHRCTTRFDGETVLMWTPCEERIAVAKARGPK